MTTDLVII